MQAPHRDTDDIVFDDPHNVCFGCSPHNEHGMSLRWRRVAEGVEALYTVPPHFNGAPGVVHGGIQAVLLDETLGVAIHEASDRVGDAVVVTAEFDLKYRQPVPTSEPLRLVGRLLRSEGRNFFAEGAIEGAEGRVLTTATARWVLVEPR